MNSCILQHKASPSHNRNCEWPRKECVCTDWAARYYATRADTERRYRATLERNATFVVQCTHRNCDIVSEVTTELWRFQDGWCIQLAIYDGSLTDPELISPDQARETLQRSKRDAEKAFEEAKARLEQAQGALARLLNP